MSDKDPSLRRNAPQLELHVPEPPSRPGDTPDFSTLNVPAAGSAPRPGTDVAAAKTHPLTTVLVRVLGDDHQAVGPWDPKLDADALRKMLRDMVTVRIFDDRMYRAQRQGKTSFYMKCAGEEAIAVAAAAAIKGDSRIARGWIGDGAAAEGDFHSAMTFAAVYNVPVILATVNNQWAISSFSGIAGGERATFAQRAVGYGIASLRVDGNDALAVYAAVKWAAERARSNGGPTLIEFFTYRAEGHSTSDDPSGYRPSNEAKAWPLGDPVERLKVHLLAIGEWDDERHAAMTAECDAAVRAAQRESEKLGVLPEQGKDDIGSMFDDVYAEVPWHLAEQREQALSESPD